MNVFSRACGCTGVAAKTLAGPAGVSVNIQMRRASFFAEATFRWAFFTVSLKKCSRQDRHQSKQRSHRAEKLAEKTLLCTHSHHDQDQQDNSHQIFTVWKPFGCYHGQNIPRACSCELSIYTGQAGKQDQCQYDIFDFLKSVNHFFRKRRFLFFVKAFRPDPGKALINSVSKGSECTGISAEMSSEKAGDDPEALRLQSEKNSIPPAVRLQWQERLI